MKISDEIKSYNSGYWDFQGVKKHGIHTLGKYPATMVAPMQYELLSIISNDNKNINKMLDPFMGSGVSLVEGTRLGLDVNGIDINPYAVLLTEVKLHDFNEKDLLEMNNRISKKLFSRDYRYPIFDFVGIDKWFREDIKVSLSKIRSIIIEEKDKWIRKYLWVILSEIIYTHSNDRTSTFKLHIKEMDNISSINDDCIESFYKDVLNKEKILKIDVKNNSEIHIYSGDSLNILKKMDNESIDIICTSPPYGDNATTVTYGQASILFLKWIDSHDLTFQEGLLDNFSRIDSSSLGGTKKGQIMPEIESISSYVNLLTEGKRKKVINFLSDYYNVLTSLNNVLSEGGYMLFTVGNRRVDGIIQPLDKITREIFRSLGLFEMEMFTRNIPTKKMPYKISNIHNKGAVKSMNKETVLIFKKGVM